MGIFIKVVVAVVAITFVVLGGITVSVRSFGGVVFFSLHMDKCLYAKGAAFIKFDPRGSCWQYASSILRYRHLVYDDEAQVSPKF